MINLILALLGIAVFCCLLFAIGLGMAKVEEKVNDSIEKDKEKRNEESVEKEKKQEQKESELGVEVWLSFLDGDYERYRDAIKELASEWKMKHHPNPYGETDFDETTNRELELAKAIKMLRRLDAGRANAIIREINYAREHQLDYIENKIDELIAQTRFIKNREEFSLRYGSNKNKVGYCKTSKAVDEPKPVPELWRQMELFPGENQVNSQVGLSGED